MSTTSLRTIWWRTSTASRWVPVAVSQRSSFPFQGLRLALTSTSCSSHAVCSHQVPCKCRSLRTRTRIAGQYQVGGVCLRVHPRTAFVFTAVWATTDLSDGLWVPTLMALPLLLSNSLFYRIRLRIVYLSTVQPILVAVACCLTRVAWCRPCCARLWLAWCLYVEAERKRQR